MREGFGGRSGRSVVGLGLLLVWLAGWGFPALEACDDVVSAVITGYRPVDRYSNALRVVSQMARLIGQDLDAMNIPEAKRKVEGVLQSWKEIQKRLKELPAPELPADPKWKERLQQADQGLLGVKKRLDQAQIQEAHRDLEPFVTRLSMLVACLYRLPLLDSFLEMELLVYGCDPTRPTADREKAPLHLVEIASSTAYWRENLVAQEGPIWHHWVSLNPERRIRRDEGGDLLTLEWESWSRQVASYAQVLRAAGTPQPALIWGAYANVLEGLKSLKAALLAGKAFHVGPNAGQAGSTP